MLLVGPVTARRLARPHALVLTILATPQMVGGLAVYGLSALLWLGVLSRNDLSLAFPILGLAYVGAAIVGRLAFYESLSKAQIIGLGLVVAGVFFVALSGAR